MRTTPHKARNLKKNLDAKILLYIEVTKSDGLSMGFFWMNCMKHSLRFRSPSLWLFLHFPNRTPTGYSRCRCTVGLTFFCFTCGCLKWLDFNSMMIAYGFLDVTADFSYPHLIMGPKPNFHRYLQTHMRQTVFWSDWLRLRWCESFHFTSITVRRTHKNPTVEI